MTEFIFPFKLNLRQLHHTIKNKSYAFLPTKLSPKAFYSVQVWNRLLSHPSQPLFVRVKFEMPSALTEVNCIRVLPQREPWSTTNVLSFTVPLNSFVGKQRPDCNSVIVSPCLACYNWFIGPPLIMNHFQLVKISIYVFGAWSTY